ncbi:MAG: tRNA pseudouridine(38-40) synthase TruA [Bacteroidia bacterium]
MPRYFIHLSYSGKNYHGWQVQENTPDTVQHVLQEALGKLLREKIEVTGCGRTDTGVHAEDFYAHFDSSLNDLHTEANKCTYKLNKMLPEDIGILKILQVSDNANARFDALSRSYEYRIHKVKNPFLNDFSWYRYGTLNIQRMNEAAELLIHTSDFTSFSKLNTQVKTNTCRVKEALWVEKGDRLIFKITADRFLRNMVRAIVGTLLEVGQEKITVSDVSRIIENKDRSDAGFSVPAHGLHLTKVSYPEELFK